MLGQIAAGLGIAGSVFGAIGASQNASAIKKAARRGQKDVRSFTKDQVEKSEKLGAKKQDYLEDGDPFAEMGKFIFGNTSDSTYSNLRKSQSDFAKLAAGDTTGFSKEVSSIVSNAISNTFGGPRGSFENLSAKNLLNFRQIGANTAISLTDYFSKSGQQLMGNKFGILDQTFDREMKLKEYETNAINQLRMQEAGTAGAGMAAIGTGLQGAAGGLNSLGAMQSNATALGDQKEYNNRYLGILERQIGGGSSGGSGGGYFDGGSKATLPVSASSGGGSTSSSGSSFFSYLGLLGRAAFPVASIGPTALSYLRPSASGIDAYGNPGVLPPKPNANNADPNTPEGRDFLNNSFIPLPSY